MKNSKLYPSSFAVISMLLWGMSFVWTSIVLEYYQPVTIIFLRLFIATGFLFSWIKLFQPKEKITNRSDSSLTSPSSHDHAPKTPLADPIPDPIPDPNQYMPISEVEKQLKTAYEDGVQNGLEKADDDYGSAIKAFFATCQLLDTVRETIIGNSSGELQEFALAIAKRIVRTSLLDNDTTIIATIEEALKRAVKSEEFYIYISPEDYDTVAAKSDELITGLTGLSNIILKKDTSVEKGGTKIESDNCTIDATIAGQFEVILEEMKNNLLA